VIASRSPIEQELLELKQELGIVIVTHNLAQARRIADRVGFFLDGELIELGSALDVFVAPEDERTRDYIAGVFG
jgi:phosphate transport system ATP-binding protein